MRVFLIYFIILILGFGLIGGYLYISINKVLAEEPLPNDFLETGDTFRLIIDTNKTGVTSVTYHYEFAD